jgi:hypothetical protein
VTRAYQLFSERLPHVELLTGSGGTAFGTTGDVEADLISITSVHPMREDAIRMLLANNGADWSVVDGLIDRGALAEVEHQGQKFLVRRFSRGDTGSR